MAAVTPVSATATAPGPITPEVSTPTDSPTRLPAPTLTPSAIVTAAAVGESVESPAAGSCAATTGTVESVRIPSPATGPIRARLYLPSCYAERPAERYPVLYLLHGKGFTEDQWERLGAATGADELIAAGEIAPLIVVMPRDAGESFDPALVDAILPYVDAHYRTLDDRATRAIGGLSRGGGWAVHFGLKYPERFGRIGLHSPAVFYEDERNILEWGRQLRDRPKPAVYLDVGDGDGNQRSPAWLDQVFTWFDFGHTYIVRPGAHTERYWAAHVSEYLRFYAAGWRSLKRSESGATVP